MAERSTRFSSRSSSSSTRMGLAGTGCGPSAGRAAGLGGSSFIITQLEAALVARVPHVLAECGATPLERGECTANRLPVRCLPPDWLLPCVPLWRVLGVY